MMTMIRDAWRIQSPKKIEPDFYSVLKPATYFGHVAGIFPLTLKGPAGRRKYSTSNTAMIYGVAVFSLIIANLFLGTNETNKRHGSLSNYTVVQMSINFELMLDVILMVVIFASVMRGKDKLGDVLESIRQQDDTLRNLGSRIDYASESHKRYLKMGLFLTLILTLYTHDFYYQLDFNSRYPLDWLAWICPNVILNANTCLCVNVILLLRQRFKLLNERLRNMTVEMEDFRPEAIYNHHRICSRLRSIAKVHRILSDAAVEINEIFGNNAVAAAIYSVIMLISSLYYISQRLRNANCGHNEIVGYFSWGIINSIDILLVVVVCIMVQNQASLTGKLIHKIEISENDTPLNNVIQSFSLQLQHVNVEFSGSGLFRLDATLIQSIVGTVTTYLVILIQFDLAVLHFTASSNRANNSAA